MFCSNVEMPLFNLPTNNLHKLVFFRPFTQLSMDGYSIIIHILELIQSSKSTYHFEKFAGERSSGIGDLDS